MRASCGMHHSVVRPHPTNHLFWDSHCWGCRWSLLKEQCNHSSMQCGCGGLGDGEVCKWGLVEAWGVPCSLVGILTTDSGVAALCFYSLCCRAMNSLTGSHLSAAWQPLPSVSWDEEQVHKCLLPLDRDWLFLSHSAAQLSLGSGLVPHAARS